MELGETYRGWKISNGSREIDSLTIENTGIACVAEDNIDDLSFSNEFIYNDDTQSYYLSTAKPNQVTFTLSFLLSNYGVQGAADLESLKTFFDQAGAEFTIVRNINKFPNTFVVNSISTSHYTNGNALMGFEVSASYVGDFRQYLSEHVKVAFNGEENAFQFDHYFEAPEPSTIFGTYKNQEYIRDLDNNTGKVEGLIYEVEVVDEIDTLRITNLTYEEQLAIKYDFKQGDMITLDTELDEPEFTLLRGTTTINLLPYIDFSVSSMPVLYVGIQSIRMDLIANGVTVGYSKAFATYWRRSE